jgi:hypothetical protein
MSKLQKYTGSVICFFLAKIETRTKSYQITNKGMQLLEKNHIGVGHYVPRFMIRYLYDHGGVVENKNNKPKMEKDIEVVKWGREQERKLEQRRKKGDNCLQSRL